jgi:FKBP-type peptidyl-prolyl cis-trans isomerase SlyD
MSLLIGDNCVVSINYTLTNANGDVIDSSAEGEPLIYLHGAGNIIPGLENALVGKTEGDAIEVTVQPDEGYGHVQDELKQEVPKEMFQGVDELAAGMVFQTQSPEGHTMMVTVTDIAGEIVTIDGNHPLAGQVLNFSVSVAAIRDASEEEIQHGHVH